MSTQIAPSVSPPPRSRRGRGRLVAAGLVLVTLAGVVAVWLIPVGEAPKPDRQVLSVNVKIRRVVPVAELPDTFTLTAVVEPEAVVHVAAEVSGRIERWGERRQDVVWRGRRLGAGAPVDEGQPVVAGEPLVHLNKDLLQARFDQARAQHEYDLREHRRILDLFERGTTSQTELDDAITQRDISRAALDAAAEELERTTIHAPTDGILNQVPVELGEFVTPGQVVAEIVNIDRVKIVVEVPEREVHYLAVGDEATVVARIPDERLFVGRITYINELADESTRTSRLEINIDNPEHVLRSGQIVRAQLTRRILQDVIMIPLSAVIPLEQGHVVYVAEADDAGKWRAGRREVELGFITGRDVRVLRGLGPGDRLIVVGHRYVGPGQPVDVIEDLSPEATAGAAQP